MGESAPAAPPSPMAPTPVGTSGTPPEQPTDTRDPTSTPAPVASPTVAKAPADSVAPADMVPPPSRRERLAWYAGTVALCTLLVIGGYRLDQADLRAPFYYDIDALLILPMVKAAVERGSHWRNERMGSAGVPVPHFLSGHELHDFPVIDHLHFAILWLMGRAFPDPMLLYNLYYLLTYPLTALTGMLFLRWMGLTLPAAACGALLYSFLPYHHQRWELHFFLAAYWVVPLSMIPALLICKGKVPLFPRDASGQRRFRPVSWPGLWVLLLCAATASAGAYYAFFACALYAAAGAYGWAVSRTWRAAASAGILAGLVALFGLINHAPTFAYQAKYGPNPVTARDPEEADMYGLKIAQLVLPMYDHRITVLARIRSRYNVDNRPSQTENEWSSLGAVAAAGLIGLVILLLLPHRKGWPYGPLTALTGYILLLAVIGGFGSVFNLLVFDQIRCYNRISVQLALLCLLAVLWPLDKFLLTRTGRARRLRYPIIAGVFVFGFLDQTPFSWFRPPIVDALKLSASRFWEDRAFFSQVEEAMLAGAGPEDEALGYYPPRVFTLPYIPYPESAPLYRMGTYEPARGYLHTHTLVWSFGAMKRREADAWQRKVAFQPSPDPPARPTRFKPRDTHALEAREMIESLIARGFDGVLIDTRGYTVAGDGNQGKVLAHKLRDHVLSTTGVPPPEVVHPDGKQLFLYLRPYREWWRHTFPSEFARRARQEREWATITWLKGFYSYERFGHEDSMRWCSKHGVAVFVNPTDRERTFELTMTFGVDDRGPFQIRLDGGATIQELRDGEWRPWADELILDHPPNDREDDHPRQPRSDRSEARGHEIKRTYRIRVPAGRHTITFRCDPPSHFMPHDSVPLLFYIRNFMMQEP